MNRREVLEQEMINEEMIFADGFDDAILGTDYSTDRVIYSIKKCIDILVKDHGMEYEEALDYFYFNTAGAYVGEMTPIWCNDLSLEYE